MLPTFIHFVEIDQYTKFTEKLIPTFSSRGVMEHKTTIAGLE